MKPAIALSLRLILFLSTAMPTLLLTEKPKRETFRLLGLTINTRDLFDQLLPQRRTDVKSFVLVRRSVLCINCRPEPQEREN